MDENIENTKTESVDATAPVEKKKSKLNFQNPLVSMSFSAFIVAGAFFAYQQFFATASPAPLMEVMESNVQMGIGEKTREEILAELEAAAAENSVSFGINALVSFENGSKKGSIMFENEERNQKYLMVELILDATGESLYKSDLIPPGSHIDTCTLNQALDKGQHSSTAMVYAFRLDDQSFIGQAAAGLILDVG